MAELDLRGKGDFKGAAEWARKAQKLVVLMCGQDCPEAQMHEQVIRGVRNGAGGSQLAASLVEAGM